jgi:hypothetical protein
MPAQRPALQLDWDQVVGWRLRRHHLDERAPGGDLLAVAAEVARITGSAELGDKLRHSWGALLKPAASRGLLCFGPSDGQLVRFTRPDQWLPAWRGDQDPEAALLETARRFLRACGAVTREDYARWWGVMAPEGGRVLERLGDEAVPVEVGGAGAWMLAAHAEEIVRASAAPSVRLLPAFDQYVVAATRHAEQLMPGPFKDRVYRPQGWLSPVLLAGGRMMGTWRQEQKGRRLGVTIEPFAKLRAAVRRQAEHEAERLAAWTGAALDLAWADTQAEIDPALASHPAPPGSRRCAASTRATARRRVDERGRRLAALRGPHPTHSVQVPGGVDIARTPDRTLDSICLQAVGDAK